jgi:hypothetical protein
VCQVPASTGLRKLAGHGRRPQRLRQQSKAAQ